MITRTLALLLALGAASALADGDAPHSLPVTATGPDYRDSPLGLSYLETEDMLLLYIDPTLAYLTPHLGRTFVNSMAWQREVFGWEPWEEVTVLIKDFSDYGNAAARADPNNALLFDAAPLSRAFETYPASERIYTLMNHELVHVATMDMWDRQDARWRRFFRGKVGIEPNQPETLLYNYLTVPRFTVPRWYLEGSAVFMETWMSGGLGRAQGAYDEMVFRAMVRDDAHFFDPLGLVSRGVRIDFQAGVNAYLYGTRFMNYLAYNYSPEHLVEWLKRDEGSERYYASEFRRVFGLRLNQAWQDWIDFEREFQGRNLEAVREHPITPYRDLVPRSLGSISRVYVDEKRGALLGAFRYPGTVAHVGALDMDGGSIRHLTDIKGPMLFRVTSLAFDPDADTLFYTADNFSMRDLMAVDVETGREQMLLRDARIGDLVFNPADRSLWGVRHMNGLASLVRIPHPYQEWNLVHAFPYGMVPYDLDISPDGQRLSASVGEVTGDQFLRVWRLDELLAGNVEPDAQFDFGQAVPEGFVFSLDGRHLYGTSYYTGVSNVFRFEVETGALEAITNAETGFFRPVPLADGALVVFNFTGEGFVPVVIDDPVPVTHLSAITFLGAEVARKHPVATTWQVDSPASVDFEALVMDSGPYAPLRDMRLQNAYPVLEGYKDSIGVGWRFNIEDPLGFASLAITASVTPDSDLSSSERGHLDVSFRYLNWRARATWNNADFFDLFGPTERSRKGVMGAIGYDRSLIFDQPRTLDFRADVAVHDNLDTLPDFQNVRAPVSRLFTSQAGLFYSNTRRSIGSVDDEKGFSWELVTNIDRVDSDFIPRLRGGFDFGFALPLRNSSIWLRNAAGIADGDRDDPFANFFLGGFGNNYVDKASIKRYRDHHAFPGFDLNEIGGRNFTRNMLELNLPPVVFERIGTPAFHLTWLRTAVFGSFLATNLDDSELRTNWQNLGVQVDLHFTVLHRHGMTISAGYAAGFREGSHEDNEWMLSLKIL
ncbi:MAG: hypothetical protein ACNA7E_00170 [Wenzhouxiangellaceae bacterium]